MVKSHKAGNTWNSAPADKVSRKLRKSGRIRGTELWKQKPKEAGEKGAETIPGDCAELR